jgi:membrane-anchored glycerophosphoryl diester phosphodiesterase (GDPDase)
MTLYIADVYLGKIPSVKESLRGFGRCVLSSIWTCILNRILIGATFIFPAAALFAIYLYALFQPPLTWAPLFIFGAVSTLLLIASIAPVLVVFMRLMVTVPALAIEGRSGLQAIQRSSDLVRYDPRQGIFYWGEMRLSFLLLPLFVIELLILSLTSLPVTVHQIGELMRHGSTGQMSAPPDSIMIVSQILTFLAGSLILPLYSIATTLFYYDIRIRREGFDLEWLAAHPETDT